MRRPHIRIHLRRLWSTTTLIVLMGIALAAAGVVLVVSTGHQVDKNSQAAQQAPKIAQAVKRKTDKVAVTADQANKTAGKANRRSIRVVKYLQGKQGLPGVAGKNGVNGTRGPAGIGKPGQQGPEGGPGPASTVPGPKGDSVKGDQGEPGFGYDCAGNQVKPGDTPAKCPGDQGPKGDKGDDGTTGATGSPGTDGATGATGPSGAPCPNTTTVTGLEGPTVVCTP